VNPTDEALDSNERAVFHPYQHHDFYGMDSLFLSPIQNGEIWNFQNITSVHPSILAFLTLRSFLLNEENQKPLEVTGLNRIWKTYLAKNNYFIKNKNLVTEHFIPGLVSNEENPKIDNDLESSDWKHSLRWEFKDGHKKTVFFVACGKKEGETSKNLSELLSQFLVESQKYDRLTRAYIRKETSSYLYLQTEGQIHPRVFFRENAKELPEFILFIAELIPA